MFLFRAGAEKGIAWHWREQRGMDSKRLLSFCCQYENCCCMQHHLLKKATVNTIRVGDCDVGKVSVVRNLGAWFDDQLAMAVHFTQGNTFRWIQLRLLSTLLLVAEETTVIVYYMVCLIAILIICREFRAQPLDLSLCWANVATLPQCSISCTGFLSHLVLIFTFYF